MPSYSEDVFMYNDTVCLLKSMYTYLHSACDIILILAIAVPQSPSVVLTVLSTGPHFVGDTLSLQCEATVSHHVNTPIFVAFTWTRNNVPLSSSSNSRVNISRTTVINSLTYRSALTISDLSIEGDSGMNYTCQAVVRSEPVSPYILSSASVTSNTYFLTVSRMLRL